MFVERTDELFLAFGLDRNRYIYIIGGGGKTSLMSALGGALAGKGHSVITTTTTRIEAPPPDRSDALAVGSLEILKEKLKRHRHVTFAHHWTDESKGKLKGFEPRELDGLYDSRAAEYVIVEADGSAGLPLKAHAEHEPVVSGRADLVIAVIGADCIGRPATDENVHRAKLFCERLGRPAGSTVTEGDVARIFFHKDGYLKKVARSSEARVFISKARNDTEKECAMRLGRALKEHDTKDRIANIVIGDLC